MSISNLFALPPALYQLEKDWLIEPDGFKASIERDGQSLIIGNGLIRREFSLDPGMATVAFDNRMTGESVIRAVRPEGRVTLDGREWRIGGLLGQRNLAFLTREWLEQMRTDPEAMVLAEVETGLPEARFSWKQVRHHGADGEWPPKGVKVSFFFEPPIKSRKGAAPLKRELLWEDRFGTMDGSWVVRASDAEERVSFMNEGKAGEILSRSGLHCFAERPLPSGLEAAEVVIHPGTDQGTSWGPGVGLVFGNRVVEVNLRPGDRGEHGHFELRDRGVEKLAKVKALAGDDGGLSRETAYRVRATVAGERLIWEVSAEADEAPWHLLFEVDGLKEEPSILRVGKTDRGGGATDEARFPGEWGRCRIEEVSLQGSVSEDVDEDVPPADVRVGVHYELYDGLPLLSKWLTVENRSEVPIVVDRLTAESLALVEHSNHVETRDGVALPQPRQLHVETDMAFGSFKQAQANRQIVHYRPDPAYKTQVNYRLLQPCLLEVEPLRGPAQSVTPGEVFESFRIFELVMDSSERERRGLALRRMYRKVAPWVTENPLMHHMRNARPEQVIKAIDQAAEVGFEMVILSFGSGFNAENDDPAYLEQWRKVADHGREKGIELGCYSLYSSRSIGGGNDIVSPAGEAPIHGRCPAVTSEWGQAYLAKLYALFRETGFMVFEHDGPYPGDVDVTARPPLQKGEEDSQWVHWRQWGDFYKWLRGRGVYINAPDYYYLSGTNKCGMGYREVNWSLPRSEQLIHTRQNIYDGSWEKTPSMGWMFVPLSQYQGGGAAATIEPLDEHIDHYERMMMSNLAFGVQACYRGPRLFDTPRVREMVRGRVEWFKRYRELLESDLIHLRRADGLRLDGMLHVNPGGDDAAMLVVFNPGEQPLSEAWTVPLYQSGLSGRAVMSVDGGAAEEVALDSLSRIRIDLSVPAGGFQWVVFSEP